MSNTASEANIPPTINYSRIVEFITEGNNCRCFTTGLFLDISKAFDKVWYKGVIVKLEKPMLGLINSLVSNRTFHVKLMTRTPAAGVPQGSALSYNLHTNNIPIPDYIPGTNEKNVAQYVDDTAILVRSLNRNRATWYPSGAPTGGLMSTLRKALQ